MRLAVAAVKHALQALGYGLAGGFVVVLVLYVRHLQDRPDLRAWHLAQLDEEFTAERTDVGDLRAYRRLEEQLFEQLHREVYQQVTPDAAQALNRYRTGSLTDPESYGALWNRTFEGEVENPRAGALLLHGLSDSPYSMRALADHLQRRGVWTLALRVPGHGTAPAALTRATWRDFVAAVRIGARHVRERVGPDAPFYIAGYSNGAALAVEYALAVLEGESVPRPDGLLLLSPAIGVSPLAALAVWQAKLAGLPGLEKLAWNTIAPEYDPYKYNSFTVNAGDQIYRLTDIIAKRMARLDSGNGVRGFPRVLAFMSAVDSTIPPHTLVERLFNRLAAEGHELVLFDVNRLAEAEELLLFDPERLLTSLFADATRHFSLTVVTNADDRSQQIVAKHIEALETAVVVEPLELAWPKGVYSLSHVALPFAPKDPVYGTGEDGRENRLTLGNLELRGEQGLLAVPAAQITRLRYNPFWPYVTDRVTEFLEADLKTGDSISISPFSSFSARLPGGPAGAP